MKDYGYYLHGRNLAIVVKDSTTGEYVTPSTSIAAGLKIEYLAQPGVTDENDVAQSSASAESDVLDINNQLALAIVDYVKSKFAESEQNYEKAMYHMREYKSRVQRYQNKRSGDGRIAIPPNPYAIR